MNVRIVCIGRLKERFWADAAAEFAKRISRFCELETVELAD
ncbi:MAG: 23S rRNA (pseudouridine(1915)-N(3))-methyltransferase RlmH, partial [Clostridia bacterium]|nr:23S rRNA (pseudouridine(1915)-N(3))-methyltransferase RlmH [Clostridia bacterium]